MFFNSAREIVHMAFFLKHRHVAFLSCYRINFLWGVYRDLEEVCAEAVPCGVSVAEKARLEHLVVGKCDTGDN